VSLAVDPTQFGNARGVAGIINRAASKHLRPPLNLPPSEWAERSVYIPAENAIPGLIRFDNAPYQREPLDMTVNPECRRITLMWGAQVGKTLLALCAQGYHIAVRPSSQMMMQPSQGDLQTWLETKFQPLVDANDELQEVIAKPRGRDGVNNQRMKSYPGGFLMFAWSGSPKTMRGRSAPFIVCDEVDGYDRTPEGHPVSLLWQRAATFGDRRKLMEISTPTIKGISHIEGAFDAGDQRRFHVPCPHCEHEQALRWAQVSWQKNEQGEHLPETAAYVCESCGCAWNDGERIAAIRKGRWIAAKPFRGHASYHLNELYSCFRRLWEIVESFIEKKATNDLQTFTNVSLAETWEEQGEKVDSTGLMQRAKPYRAPVPASGVYLTAGVDMQTDRLEVEVVAWGVGEQSWSIDYHVLWGDPLQQDVWDDLDDYLAQTWQHESGAQLAISSTCVDTGGTSGYTQAAYEYLKGKTGRRIFAIKGVGGWGRPIVSSPSRKRTGKKQRPVDLFAVGTDEAKLIVMRRLAIAQPGPGYCAFPDSRDAEYFLQLTAETLRTRYIKGAPVREWHQTRDRNEALDCRVYAFAALKILSPNLAKLAERFQPESASDSSPPTSRRRKPLPALAQEIPPEESPPADGQTGTIKRSSRLQQRQQKRKRRGGGWVNNW
jgi:phage terminase large subunit GpA-like protein